MQEEKKIIGVEQVINDEDESLSFSSSEECDGDTDHLLDTKILKAFGYDMSQKEVCCEVGITFEDLTYWMSLGDNAKRADIARQKPILQARKIFVQKAALDPDYAIKYLIKKAPDEFMVIPDKKEGTQTQFMINLDV